MDKTVTMRSVRHAAALAGGAEALAVRVGASAREVLEWSSGASEPSTMAFLRVLDVIVAETKKAAAKERSL